MELIFVALCGIAFPPFWWDWVVGKTFQRDNTVELNYRRSLVTIFMLLSAFIAYRTSTNDPSMMFVLIAGALGLGSKFVTFFAKEICLLFGFILGYCTLQLYYYGNKPR